VSPQPAAATRRLAHLLLHRAVAGVATDEETAARVLDTRLVPEATSRAKVIREALALSRAAQSFLEENAGEFHADLRVAVRGRNDRLFSITVPSVLVRPDRSAAVLVMVPAGDPGAKARARRYRFAARSLLERPTEAFLLRPDGTATRLSLTRDRRRG